MNEAEMLAQLRTMFAQQWRTDEEGGREVAAWYWLDGLTAAAGAELFDEDDPEKYA
jgi:hypothetical protein